MKSEFIIIKKKINIVLLLTPFHLIQFKKVKNEIIDPSDVTIIFYNNKSVNIDKTIQHNHRIRNAPFVTFNFYEILYNPLKIFHYRKTIRKLKIFFRDELTELKDIDTCSLIVFSFHGILPQVLRDEMKYYNPTIIEIEEGLSYYYQYNWQDKILSFLYAFITPILLNFKLEYRGNIGKNKSTKILYARFPELLPNKIPGIEYKKIKSAHSSVKTEKSVNKEILIFTSPFSEYKLLPVETERKVLRKIIYIAKMEGYKIYIKCHPSEDENKYEDIFEGAIVLDHKMEAEKINYFDYNKIIHFGSSVIIDLFEKNFPKKNIISIKLVSFSNNLKVFLNPTHAIEYNKNFNNSLRKVLNE